MKRRGRNDLDEYNARLVRAFTTELLAVQFSGVQAKDEPPAAAAKRLAYLIPIRDSNWNSLVGPFFDTDGVAALRG